MQKTNLNSKIQNTSNLLTVNKLNVYYGKKHAVEDLTIEVQAGIIYGLLGPNGAGKTSTLSAIEGLLIPQSGSILVAGIDINKDPLKAKACLGVQLQTTSFQSELSIYEIIRLYAALYGVTISKPEIIALLRSIQLEEEASKRIKELSGGQQQRVSLLISTIHEPLLVLLDEPTSGLDPQSRRQLWDRIGQIRNAGRSILLTTHSMEEAQAICDFISIIDHGKIIASGSPDNLITEHKSNADVIRVAHGAITLEDVFIGLTGKEIRE
jgi:ABC-2 type transport system ATP-binding protein